MLVEQDKPFSTASYAYLTLANGNNGSEYTVSVVNDDGSLSPVSTDDGRANALDSVHQTIVLFGGPSYVVTLASGKVGKAVFAYFIPA